MISVLLPTRTRHDLFPQAFGSLLFQMSDCSEEYEVIVVNDNNANFDNPTTKLLNRLGIKYAFGPCQGSAAAFELAANISEGEKLLFINDDVIFYQPFIQPMLSMYDSGYQIVGAKLLYENMTIQHAGMEFLPHLEWTSNHRFRWMPEDLPEANKAEPVPCVTFSLTLISHDVWDELDGFDVSYFGENFSDTDFCLRALESGYNIGYQPEACAIHLESATRGHNFEMNEKTFNMYKANWVFNNRVQNLLKEKGFIV